MTAANGSAPPIDARQLRAARKRTFTAAGKALASLEEMLAAHRAELGDGNPPPASGLRKATERYLGLLAALDTMDSLLTPEALEALHAGHEADDPALDYPGWQQDLALLTAVITSLHPEVPADGRTPLGRLTAAAHPGGLAPSHMGELTVPAPQGS